MIRAYNDGHKGATAFFRNRVFLEQFFSLLEQVPGSEINVLVHASSVGAEPYSLALWWLHRRGARKPLQIYATDLDAGFLQVAQAAVYPASILDGMTPEEQSWFERCAEGVRVPADARAMVQFLPSMSFVDGNPSGSFDAVLVMNALTYVTPQQQAQAINTIATYARHLIALTAFHPDSICKDIQDAGFTPYSGGLESIHAAWGDRLTSAPISPDSPDYSWRLPPFDAEHPEYAYRFCSIFTRAPQVSEIDPQLKTALEEMVQLATQRHQAGDLANAELMYGKVLEFLPTHAAALHNLGLIYLNRGDIGAAQLLLTEAVKQNPGEATFHYNLGLAYQQQNVLPEAEKAYEKAVRLRPGYRAAWENLGVVLQDQECFEEALRAYRRASAIDPDSKTARDNIGVVLRELGQVDAALQHYGKYLDRTPLDCDLAFTYGVTLLSVGNYAQGWRLNEWRYWSPMCLEKGRPYRVPLPKWDGSDLSGRHLLAYGEQGIGDEIMAASCLNDVSAAAGKVTLLCDARLVPLFARSFSGVQVLPKARNDSRKLIDEASGADLRISLDSLPKLLRRGKDSFPRTSYLKADPAAVEVWRKKLAALGKPIRVGLSWRGGADARAKTARSVALQELSCLFQREDIAFVNLQYGCHEKEIDTFNAQAVNSLISFPESDPLRDMDDFAALITALDLVISVDNSTVHLSGALGVPTWVMLPAHADWRWARDTAETVWYPTLRLFWQKKFGSSGWPEVVARVCDQLNEGIAPPQPVPDRSGRIGSVGLVAASANQDPRPRAVLLNDTSYWYHWGCSATSLALHQGLRDAGLSVSSVPATVFNEIALLPGKLEDFDDDTFFLNFCAANQLLISQMQDSEYVIINGEGTLHGLLPASLALLYTAYIAKTKLGKNTQIINHSGFPRDATVLNQDLADRIYAMVYGALDFVAVREEQSRQELARIGVGATAGFDCLPLFVKRHPPGSGDPQARVVIAGAVNCDEAYVKLVVRLVDAAHKAGLRVDVLVGANAYLAPDDMRFVNALHPYIRGRYNLVDAQSEAEWLDALAGAKVLISGRFHHTIAAACVGTPVLVAASNTEKMSGLLGRLRLDPETVWIAPSDAAGAERKFRNILQSPDIARISDSTLGELHELAARNFDGLKGAAIKSA